MLKIVGVLLILVGFLLGIGTTVSLMAIVGGEIAEWLNRWQTLISGAVALLAGFATAAVVVWQTRETVRGTRAQIDADEAARKEARSRKRIAARIVLPSDLSSICDYAESCVTWLVQIKNLTPSDLRRVPEIPERVIANLQQLTETLSNGEAEVIAELLSIYQVLHARMRGFVDRGRQFRQNNHMEIDGIIRPCIEVMVRANAMFDFGRREVGYLEKPKFDETEISSAMSSLNIRDICSHDDMARMKKSLKREFSEQAQCP